MAPSTDAAARPLRAEDFEALVDRRVAIGETGVVLLLVAVERWPNFTADARARTPFVLTFSGQRSESYLREGLYPCDFSSGIVHEIYIAPIPTEAADLQDYQASFN